jgi:uncharacterized membrane protein YdjX (TVP38/TMEM64 family)
MISFLFFPSFRDFITLLFSDQGLEKLTEWIKSLGYWGPIISILIMILHNIIFIPAEVILFANIYIFGLSLGSLYTWIGSMLGAYLSFYVARIFGRPVVKRFFAQENINKFDQWIEEKGTFGLFVLRLIPLFSFNLLNRDWNYPTDGCYGMAVFECCQRQLEIHYIIRFCRHYHWD